MVHSAVKNPGVFSSNHLIADSSKLSRGAGGYFLEDLPLPFNVSGLPLITVRTHTEL